MADKVKVEKVKKLTKEQQGVVDAWLPMWKYGASVGCPPDQLQRFMGAGLALQPKQLEFCAAARECDLEGGPTAVMSGVGQVRVMRYWLRYLRMTVSDLLG